MANDSFSIMDMTISNLKHKKRTLCRRITRANTKVSTKHKTYIELQSFIEYYRNPENVLLLYNNRYNHYLENRDHAENEKAYNFWDKHLIKCTQEMINEIIETIDGYLYNDFSEHTLNWSTSQYENRDIHNDIL